MFKVICAAQPDLAGSLGHDPEHLGRVTAEECFRQADVDGNGAITFNEFRHWYHDSQSTGPSVASLASALPGWLVDARRLTHLDAHPVSDVMEKFAEFANKEGLLDRRSFAAAFAQFLPPSLSAADTKRVSSLLVDIFQAFDTNGDEVVDFTELVCGLSLLCGASADERVRAVFDLFDTDGDGTMSRPEMQRYLTSVFSLLYASDESLETKVGMPPAELAAATVEQCFNEVDTDHDGRVSFDEFSRWHTDGMTVSVSHLPPPAPSAPPAPNATSGLAEAKLLTGLANVQVADATRLFAKLAVNGVLPFDRFREAFDVLAKHVGVPDSPERTALLQRLFHAFDYDRNGTLNFAELASGLTILCVGSPMHKLESAFALMDYNNDGSITYDELRTILTAVYTVLFETDASAAARCGVTPGDLAAVTAKNAFQTFDLNRDSRLSLDEFKQWYSSQNMLPAETRASRSVQPERAAAPTSAGAASSLPPPSTVLNIAHLSVADVVARVARHADHSGRLSHDSFLDAFEQFVTPGTPARVVRAVLDRLFQLFDVNADSTVSAAELSAGLSVMCSGSSGSDLEAVFRQYDIDHDGFVRYDEMVSYLSSVFTVLYETKPGLADRMGVSARDLAETTATQCFMDADVNADGKLSLEEFKRWYTGFRGDGVDPAGASVAAVVGAAAGYDPAAAAAAAAGVSSTLHDLKVQSGLAVYKAADVILHFADFADERGNLSRRTFHAAFAGLGPELPAAGPLNDAHAMLFDALDANRDGVVSFNELASGLSMLCDGTPTEKAEVAFACYDLDGDG